MEDEEQRRLEEEDFLLEDQLTAIMKAFEQLRSEYPGTLKNGWAHWWQRVDEVLPELIPEERCRCKGLNRAEKEFHALLREKTDALFKVRADLERDTAESKGFQGKQFDEFIKIYLAKGRSL